MATTYTGASRRSGASHPPIRSSLPRRCRGKIAVKRSTEWVGYKVHFTETCADEHPRLITDVETTVATTHDVNVTEQIQDNLIAKGLQPETQLVDMGYMEADLLVSSQEKGIELVGPVPSSKSWQDRVDEAFDHTQFDIDWQQRVATCPDGKTSASCTDRQTRRGTPNLVFKFSPADCQPCSLRPRCSRAKLGGRTLTVYPQDQYQALVKAREQQETDEFREQYAARAGIEGTISQATRTDESAPQSLYRSGSHSTPACRNSCCHQCIPPGQLAAGRASNTHTSLAIPGVGGQDDLTSPTNSGFWCKREDSNRVGENQ